MAGERQLGLLVNTQKPSARSMVERLLSWGHKNGVNLLFPPHEASVLGVPGVSDEEWKRRVDIAVVIGGDGTFLRAARYVLNHSIPLYGINVGHLGFLASGNPEDAERDIRTILGGTYEIQTRKILEGSVWRGAHQKHQLFALNDLVLTKGAFARVVTMEISLGGRLLHMLRSDGMIVSTPTGSTAYALSAGGPIVPPHVPCMICAPICAHTLYARPMVVAENDVISISPRGDCRDLVLTQDGQLGYEILPGDHINITISREKNIKMIILPKRDYYYLLQEKLKWGQDFIDYDRE